ncbi:probable fucosyltransferase 8 isoform X1 [Physcomitrium patens]|nr:probable fucosyltransferase 8 isoform X1 [Physcomitrium patens]|eukprot:XP_024392232.1 probable fucosyltransferase 8 isoform X1 [Physcomitrella patens]
MTSSRRCGVHRGISFLFILMVLIFSCLYFSAKVPVSSENLDEFGLLPIIELNDTELRERRVKLLENFITSLQESTRLATGGEDESDWFTEEARVKWNRENPCLSRREMRLQYKQRKHVPYVEPNSQWQEVLREYSKLHRTCLHRIGDPVAYFTSQNSTVECKFTILDTELAAGLGNRLVMIASAFAYSLITQRVLLIARPGILPPQLLCEPFEGSSWLHFDPNQLVTPFNRDSRGLGSYWNKSGSFHSRIDIARGAEGGDDTSQLIMDYAVANGEGGYTEQLDSRFFCDTEQDYYKNVTWVYIMGCIYFAPKLYAVPSFRPVLDALFPDKMMLTNLLRDVMSPSDVVWEQVKSIQRDYGLQRADRRLGIQVRYRYQKEQFDRMDRVVEARIWQCAINNHLLPPVVTNSRRMLPHVSNRTTSVFVASLFDGVKNNLSDTFATYPTETGEHVEVFQFSHEGLQKFGVKIFQDALAEIITLSYSDYLFVTPQSTFSGVAQAYGGLIPWFIGFRDELETRPPCTRGQTVDTCFQVPLDYVFQCRYDSAVHRKEISTVYPDIQKCLEADTPGLQLITKQPEIP